MTEQEALLEVRRIGQKIMAAIQGEGIFLGLDALANVHRFIYKGASKEERMVIIKCLIKLQADFERIDNAGDKKQ